MRLHLIRHGQTDWNAERRVQGQSESRLTDLGIQQAREFGERVNQLHFDHLYCSSSLRTRQTAEHAFGSRPVPVRYLDSLREIYLGPWEGRLYAEMEIEQPDSFRHFWEAPHLFQVDGAETFAQLQQRAIDTVNDIKTELKEGDIAIVSHGALIKALLCHFEGRELSEMWAPPSMHNCAHSIVKLHDDGRAQIIQYADQKISED